MEANKIPLVVVAGPTASGKTALAVALAGRFDGEVVSADSMQIYKRMDIATAKPTCGEMQGIPHHLLDFLEPSQPFSVADYAAAAHRVIRDIHTRGKLPIMAGGTGLYIDSVVNNITFAEIVTDPALRTRLEQLARTQGAAPLLEELRKVDPESAEKIHPNNLPRMIRAVEVYRLTGLPMSEHQRRSRLQPSPYRTVMLGLNFRDRKTLYDRIDSRVDQMLAAGLLQEAREMLADDSFQTAAQAIGYKELKRYFSGMETLPEAAEKIRQETRRYAKRQLTWFRKNPDIQWLYVEDYAGFSDLAEEAAKKVNVLFKI